MNILAWLFDSTHNDNYETNDSATMDINPVSGLPMMEGGFLDVAGNPFGTSEGSLDMDGSGLEDTFNSPFDDSL